MVPFSVLLSVYKGENSDFLKRSLNSVFHQSLPPSEVILVKDGPLTKELDNAIEEFQTRHALLKVIPLPDNVGLGMALNEGIKYCSYELIARMDTDDICKYNRFEKQVKFLINRPDIVIVGSDIEEFRFEPGDLGTARILPETYEELEKFAKKRCPLNHPSVMYRKTAILKVGGYESMLLFEDYFLWAKILVRGYKIANIPLTLLYFRVGNDMVRRRHGLSYALKELRLLKNMHKVGFFTFAQLFFAVSIRFPLRLLPKKLLNFFYLRFLR